MMEHLTHIRIDYPEEMSNAERRAMDDKLNALFEQRGFSSEAEMRQAVLEAVQEHLGQEMQFAPSPAQVLLEVLPLMISAVMLVVGICWRYGWV